MRLAGHPRCLDRSPSENIRGIQRYSTVPAASRSFDLLRSGSRMSAPKAPGPETSPRPGLTLRRRLCEQPARRPAPRPRLFPLLVYRSPLSVVRFDFPGRRCVAPDFLSSLDIPASTVPTAGGFLPPAGRKSSDFPTGIREQERAVSPSLAQQLRGTLATSCWRSWAS